MTKEKKSTINVQGSAITILSQKEDDFICLTDMAKKFGGDDLIHNWMRNRNTLEFLGIWELIHNPAFKSVEFDTFKKNTESIEKMRFLIISRISSEWYQSVHKFRELEVKGEK
ncbi:MAG: KilA-N domain-containing protein [Bacteroidales bacterium]